MVRRMAIRALRGNFICCHSRVGSWKLYVRTSWILSFVIHVLSVTDANIAIFATCPRAFFAHANHSRAWRWPSPNPLCRHPPLPARATRSPSGRTWLR